MKKNKLKAMDQVQLSVAQKAHPSLSPEFEHCTGDPVMLPTGTRGMVMKAHATTQRALVQYKAPDGERFGWTNFECLELAAATRLTP